MDDVHASMHARQAAAAHARAGTVIQVWDNSPSRLYPPSISGFSTLSQFIIKKTNSIKNAVLIA
jgi:hypothetical protein